MKKLIIFSVLICFSFSFPKTPLVLEEISPNPQITAKPGLVTPTVSIPMITSGKNDQPPFGTIVQQWTLNMGGTYQGAGITWRQDSGRFYLIAQRKAVYSFRPENPTGTLRQERWNFQSVGGYDIPWGIVWDVDSNCFWISHIGTFNTGCWLYRYIYDVVHDSWEWRGTPRDTWNVASSTIAWTEGMVKNYERGYFWVLPVASTPDDKVKKWDFYTKTQIGQSITGSGRGIAWINYDSNYVITSSMYELLKRDTFGNILQQSIEYYNYADCELWDKFLPNLHDTVFIFIIASDENNTLYKVSTGMEWSQLYTPVLNDVGVEQIFPPTGFYDSSSVITPGAIIRNYGTTLVSDFWTRFWIFRATDSTIVYRDSVFTDRLAVGVEDTLSFTPFFLNIPRGTSFILKCSTMVIDVNPWNDAKECTLTVIVHDVGTLGIIYPPLEVNFGDTIVPQAFVKNYGTAPENFWVRFKIDLAYIDTLYVTSLPPDTLRLISFKVWVAGPPGLLTCRCSTELSNDANHSNDRKVHGVFVNYYGTDVGITRIIIPADTMYPGTINPKIRLENFGTEYQNPECIFQGYDSLGTEIYCDTQETTVVAGEIVDLEFDRDWSIDTGNYSCFAERFYPPDQWPDNDTMSKSFLVKPSPALLEFKVNLSETRITAVPNPFNNKILLSYTKAYKVPTFLAIYNLEGRIIRTLVKQQQETGQYIIYWDGKDSEFRDMPAGIYFILWKSGEKATIKKIIKK